MFVDPVLEPNVTAHLVHFPRGANYVDWLNTSHVFVGGSSALVAAPLDGSTMSYPVFHKAGALLVRNIIDGGVVVRPLQPPLDEPLQILLPCPAVGQRDHSVIRRWRQPSQEVWYTYRNATTLEIAATAHVRALHFVVTGVPQPRVCERDGGVMRGAVACALRGHELHIASVACRDTGAHIHIRF